MKTNSFHHVGLFLVILMLASLACGVGDTGIVEPEAGVTVETAAEAVPPSDAVEEPVTEPENAPEQAAETENARIDPIKTALSQQYDGEAAFVAVAAAMERGYSFNQIEAASIAGRLDANGNILADDNTIVPPDGPPAGVLDLTNLQVKRNTGTLFRPPSKPLVQEGLQSVSWLLQEIEGLSASSETVADEDAEFRFVVALLYLHKTGYTLDQIVEAIVLGAKMGDILQCAVLVDVDGKPIVPNQSNDDCEEFLFSNYNPENDPDNEPVAEEASEAVEESEEGDIALFCEIYAEFSDDVQRSVDAYAEAAGCVEDCGASQILDDLEIRMDDYIDQLAEVAPPEIKETMTQLAAETVVGISSSEGRPELEPLLEAMDNFAGEKCGISFASE